MGKVNSSLTAVYDTLEHALARQCATPTLYATVDFDNSCIFNDIGEATLAYLCENGLLRNPSLLSSTPQTINEEYHQDVFRKYHAFLDQQEIQQAYEFGTQMLGGYTSTEARDLLESVLIAEGEVLSSRELFGRKIERGLQVKLSTQELLRHLAQQGIAIWVISASPKVLVEPVFGRLFPGLSYHCIALETEVVEDVLTGHLILPTPTFHGKVECIQKYVHPVDKPILAVGDSVNDLSMLEYAEIKVVVNRENRLAEIARERGWHLI